MTRQKLYKLIFNISILICLLGLVTKVSLVMTFLPQLCTWENLNHDPYPMLTAPLSEYEYFISDNTKQDKFFNVRFCQAHPFIKICPYLDSYYLKCRYYDSHQGFTDNRIKIRYLILAHFHGSRYKDGIFAS